MNMFNYNNQNKTFLVFFKKKKKDIQSKNRNND